MLRLHASHDSYVDTILSLTAAQDPSTDFSLVSMTANATKLVDILGSGKTRIHAGGLLVNAGGATVSEGLTVSDTGAGLCCFSPPTQARLTRRPPLPPPHDQAPRSARAFAWPAEGPLWWTPGSLWRTVARA